MATVASIKHLDRIEGAEIVVACSADMTCEMQSTKLKDSQLTKKIIFQLEMIPDTMSRLNMPLGAALMKAWFSGPPREMTIFEKLGRAPYPANLTSTNLIKMNWALSFSPANAAFSKLQSISHLSKTSTHEVLINKIKTYIHGQKIGTHNISISNVPLLHEYWQFQYVQVSSLFNDVSRYLLGADDLYAALANFMLCAAPAKIIITAESPTQYVISIPEIAIYVRDTYEFYDDAGDDQYLGHWNKSGLKMSLGLKSNIISTPSASSRYYFPVSNSTFRNWRNMHGRGSDLLVFSDVRVAKLTNSGINFKVEQSRLA